MFYRYKYKILAAFGTLTLIFIWIFNAATWDQLLKSDTNHFSNHFHLEDIDTAEVRPYKSDQQIFLLETSCSLNMDCTGHLTARHSCAIESVAHFHPNHTIFVLFFTFGDVHLAGDAEMLENVRQYPNVHLRKVNLDKYSENTPFEQFFVQKRYARSNYLTSHLSDILRYLTLWKYGGLYLDNDIVCLRNFDALGTNFAVADAPNSVMSAAIHLGNNHVGQLIAEKLASDIIRTFDGTKWSVNGPGVITRVLSQFCQKELTALMTRDACQGFQVLPRETFLPVLHYAHHYYFMEEHTKDVMRLINGSYIAHIYEHANKNMIVKKDADVAYALIAKQYCPDMFNAKSLTF